MTAFLTTVGDEVWGSDGDSGGKGCVCARRLLDDGGGGEIAEKENR